MPSYDYKCDHCEVVQEIEHRMQDTYEDYTCELCSIGLLHKMFRPAATHFKGQGWGKVYRVHKPKGN